MQLNAAGNTWLPVKEATEDLQGLKYLKHKTLDGELHAEELLVGTGPKRDKLVTMVEVSTKVYWEWKAKKNPEDALEGF